MTLKIVSDLPYCRFRSFTLRLLPDVLCRGNERACYVSLQMLIQSCNRWNLLGNREKLLVCDENHKSWASESLILTSAASVLFLLVRKISISCPMTCFFKASNSFRIDIRALVYLRLQYSVSGYDALCIHNWSVHDSEAYNLPSWTHNVRYLRE